MLYLHRYIFIFNGFVMLLILGTCCAAVHSLVAYLAKIEIIKPVKKVGLLYRYQITETLVTKVLINWHFITIATFTFALQYWLLE